MKDVLTQAPDSPEVGRAGAPYATVSSGEDDARVAPYVALFDRRVDRSEPQWVGALRRSALDRFVRLGFPTTKNEDWHFTSVAPITAHAFDAIATPSSVTREQLTPFLFPGEWETMVFVNGVFAPALSSVSGHGLQDGLGVLTATIAEGPQWLERRLGAQASDETNAFTALNTALFQDGACLTLPPNVVLDRPIHLLFVTDANAGGVLVAPRTLIALGHHAEATVVESYVALGGGSTYLTNAVTEVSLAAGARLRHYKVQREGASAYHVGSSYAHQEQDSVYESFSFAVGAALSRTNVSTVLDGPGAHVTMNGLYMVDGRQTVDHQTRIEHAAPSCTSHEVYKGVLDGESHGVFNGKVYVRPEAQQTDGKQSNNNLLLSDRARADTKPQLEIFADDVKCTHGATVGRLDETALFYLKSRGVGPELSRRLLTYAFAADVLEELTVDAVRTQLEALTFRRFGVDN